MLLQIITPSIGGSPHAFATPLHVSEFAHPFIPAQNHDRCDHSPPSGGVTTRSSTIPFAQSSHDVGT